MTGLLQRVRDHVRIRSAPRPLSYEEEKTLASHSDAKVRRRLAARSDARPEILYYLAEDPSPEVRREIAANESTPVQADLILACDEDEEVRCDLAQKIARLMPDLSPDEKDRVYRYTVETLETLTQDTVVRVRRILAEALKDVTHAPHGVIKRLAQDAEIEVAAPVLRCSPLLSDDDLLEIIRSRPPAGALAAISRRAVVASGVADAIADSDDREAVAVLLANPSAQIREETLDRIIERAPAVEEWHEPLVRRPRLPPHAARRIAHFVAASLLGALQRRGDLDAETAREVAAVMERRLEEEGDDAAAETDDPDSGPSGGDPYEEAERLHADGKLDEKAVATALHRNRRGFVAAALAVRSGLPQGVVNKVINSHSAKGMTALAWKAGLSMRLATQLQTRLARVAPNAALYGRNGVEYPLSPDEMDWQLEFFQTMVPGARTAAAD